jgi:multidrug resistance efflux pump
MTRLSGLSKRTETLFAILLFAFWSAGCRRSIVQASSPDIPTAPVQQSDIQLRVNTNGALRTVKSADLPAPAIGGGTLQILEMKRTGEMVKAGDVIIRFDPSQQQYSLDQSLSDVQQAEQEILKAKADAAVQEAQDKTALLKAKYAVRRAELDVSKNEILSKIDGQKNQLALDEAKRALAQLQDDIQSHAKTGEASLALSEEKRNKARLTMRQAQQNIDSMVVKSPIDGLVVVHKNTQGRDTFGMGAGTPDFHVGDQVNPGENVVEVIDAHDLEITAKVNETEGAMLKVGQKAEVRLDALPDEVFSGTVTNISGVSSGGGMMIMMIGSSQGQMGVTIHIDKSDPRLKPGFGANMTILGDTLPKALSVPRESVWDRGGKTQVYTLRDGDFVLQDVKVRAYAEGRAVIEGLPVGVRVALVNPEEQRGDKKKETVNPTGSIGQ